MCGLGTWVVGNNPQSPRGETDLAVLTVIWGMLFKRRHLIDQQLAMGVWRRGESHGK